MIEIGFHLPSETPPALGPVNRPLVTFGELLANQRLLETVAGDESVENYLRRLELIERGIRS